MATNINDPIGRELSATLEASPLPQLSRSLTSYSIPTLKKTLSHLEDTCSLIEDPSSWTKIFLASTGVIESESGPISVPPRSRKAECWCLKGALVKTCPRFDREQLVLSEKILIDATNALDLERNELNLRPNNSITAFNDTHSHDEVMEVLDFSTLAIEQAIKARKFIILDYQTKPLFGKFDIFKSVRRFFERKLIKNQKNRD